MEIELSVKIREEDFVEISKEDYNKKMKYFKWGVRIIIFFGSFVVVYSLLHDWANDIQTNDLANILFLFFLIIFLIIGVPQLRIYDYRTTYKKNKSIQDFTHYSINDEFINIKMTLSEGKISWEAINEVLELRNWILIKPNKRSYYALPKNQLNSSQQVWLKEKVVKSNSQKQ